MDEERAEKFLSAEDARVLQKSAEMYDAYKYVMDLKHLGELLGIVDLGELLGIVDRLLTTTAFHNEQNLLHAAALGKAEQQLTQYQSFGDLKPWFGGPQAGLSLKAGTYDRVFGMHEGTPWSFQALSQRVTMLTRENDQLQKLADKPMAILDDAQGYYTVSSPITPGERITVKQLVQRSVSYRKCIAEYEEALTRNRMESDHAVNTINRKDAKLLEQQKRIDELEAENAKLVSHVKGYQGMSYLNGVEAFKFAGKLRSTQEDYGDVMVALMDTEERNDVLVRRLDKITELTDDITDVAQGEKDEELKDEAEMDAELGRIGVDIGDPEGDHTVYVIYDRR